MLVARGLGVRARLALATAHAACPAAAATAGRVRCGCVRWAHGQAETQAESRQGKAEARRERIRKILAELTPEEKKVVDSIIRVDHAGELGADRIYAGQMAVLKNTDVGPVVQHMWDEEKRHLAKFEDLISTYRVRPTVLHPIWSVAGYALGAGSAMLGKEAAMACTVAVETVITDHYNAQLRKLLELRGAEDKFAELRDIIQEFRDDEMHHHDTGIMHDAEKTPFYQVYKSVLETGCRGAIWLAERY